MKLGLFGLLLIALPAIAADFRPFNRDSRAAIEQAHAGKPFVMAFWSVDCVYCPEEIQHLGALVRQRPDVKLVLVSVDGMGMAAEADAKLSELLPAGQGERWLFADGDTDRLVFSVDRKWHGELPRTYFYDHAGRVRGISGQVGAAWLDAWAAGLPRRD